MSIKNNTTDLQLILDAVNNLTSGSNEEVKTEFESWTLTLNDGTTKEESMEKIKYYTIKYGSFDEGISITNDPITKIRSGSTLEITFTNPYNEMMTIFVDGMNDVYGDYVGAFYVIKSGETLILDNIDNNLEITAIYGEWD